MFLRSSTACFLLFRCVGAFGQASGLGEKAVREFQTGDWPSAERDFREVVKRDPSNIVAQIYLGQSLFRRERYAEAAVFF